MESTVSSLEKDYCPPIDSALFHAIISDYDLSLQASISEHLIHQEVATSSKMKVHMALSQQIVHNPGGGDASRTEETDVTSHSYTLDGLDIDDREAILSGTGRGDLGADTESLPTGEKEALLAQIFPSVKPFDISYTLKKSKYNFVKTVEELLNQVFILEEATSDGEPHSVPKGIEGFISTTSRKAKGKRRKQNSQPRRSSSTTALSDQSVNFPMGPSLSKWDQAASDISYLTQRTHHPSASIASLYHKHNASLPATIIALCSSPLPNPQLDLDYSSDLLASQAIDLAHDFPTLPARYLTPILILTYPSLSSAQDLSAIIAKYDPSSSVKITPEYIRTIPPIPSPPLQSKPFKPPLGPLTAAAADALVNATATLTSLDLHGVDVRNSLRITRTYVESWWSSGVSEYAREGKAQNWLKGGTGFVIVVGQGLHSEGGRAKVGPAVARMLLKEGWRVEVGVGSLIVRGRVRMRKT